MCAGDETDNSVAPAKFHNITDTDNLIKVGGIYLVYLYDSSLDESVKETLEEISYEYAGTIRVAILDTLGENIQDFKGEALSEMPVLLMIKYIEEDSIITKKLAGLEEKLSMKNYKYLIREINAQLSGRIAAMDEIIEKFVKVQFMGQDGDTEEIFDEMLNFVDNLSVEKVRHF